MAKVEYDVIEGYIVGDGINGVVVALNRKVSEGWKVHSWQALTSNTGVNYYFLIEREISEAEDWLTPKLEVRNDTAR